MNSAEATIPEGLKKVPPFPPIAARLLALLLNPSVDVGEVAELIGSDATFTARVLQRVNSIEWALPYPVSNVHHAVSLLGLDLTRQLIVMYATAAYTKGALRTAELRKCWQHTIATAVLAEEIAQSCEAFTHIAFTAGIMHDIGRLGLLVAYPEKYERTIHDAAERCLDLLDFEREEFGMHHAEAGRLLAERWGLPDELRIVAGRHHDPCEGAELDLLRIVHVACNLADALGYNVTLPLIRQPVSKVLAELPLRGRSRIEATTEQLCARVEQKILEYDSVNADAPPEPAPPVQASANSEEPQPAFELSRAIDPNSTLRIAIGAMAALAVFGLLLLWEMR